MESGPERSDDDRRAVGDEVFRSDRRVDEERQSDGHEHTARAAPERRCDRPVAPTRDVIAAALTRHEVRSSESLNETEPRPSAPVVIVWKRTESRKSSRSSPPPPVVSPPSPPEMRAVRCAPY